MGVLRVAVTTSIGEGYAVGPEAFQECVVLYILEMPLKYSHLNSFIFCCSELSEGAAAFERLLPFPPPIPSSGSFAF